MIEITRTVTNEYGQTTFAIYRADEYGQPVFENYGEYAGPWLVTDGQVTEQHTDPAAALVTFAEFIENLVEPNEYDEPEEAAAVRDALAAAAQAREDAQSL